MSRILFVGADTMLTDMVGKLLARNGFDVMCAVGVAEAYKAVSAEYPDVVAADLETGVPQMVRFCHEVTEISPKTKLLLISENSDDEIPILNAGADDWIKKPYRMRVLYARVNVLLR